MPFLSKYFLKKKGKGLKECLQGKYRKRENTTEILEGAQLDSGYVNLIRKYLRASLLLWL